MKKRLLAAVLLFTLILPLLFSSCSILRVLRERIKEKQDKETYAAMDTLPENADEIVSQLYDEIYSVNNDSMLQDVSDRFIDTVDPDVRSSLYEEQAENMKSLQDTGMITDLDCDAEQFSFHYKVSGVPITYAMAPIEDNRLGSANTSFPEYSVTNTVSTNPGIAIPLSRTTEHTVIPDVKNLKAAVLAWDDKPFSRDSWDSIQQKTDDDLTVWDLVQVYDHLLQDSEFMDVTLDRYDDLRVSDISPEVLGQYDIIAIITHGYLSGDSPFMITSQLHKKDLQWFISWSSLSWQSMVIEAGLEVYFNAGLMSGEAGRCAVGGQYIRTHFKFDSLKARWVHLGVCQGMDGDNYLAYALCSAGAAYVTGYNDYVGKGDVNRDFRYMIPTLLNLGTMNEAMSKAKQDAFSQQHLVIRNDEASTDQSIFCGFRIELLTDLGHPDYSKTNQLHLYWHNGKDFQYFESYDLRNESILLLGLDYGTRFRALIEMEGFEPIDTEFVADYSLNKYEFELLPGEEEPDTDTPEKETEETQQEEYKPTDLEAARDRLLAELAGRYGVMPIGTDNIESDIATNPIYGLTQGMLVADQYDYDRDREDEVLILRNEPTFDHGRSIDHLFLEVYEYENGDYVFSASREFTAYALSNTYAFRSFSLFRYASENDYGKAIFIGLELYGQMNSQNTTVLVLHYDGEAINIMDGANYGEWDGSDDMKSSFAVPANHREGFILERNGDGFNDWTQWATSGVVLNESVLEEFRSKLRALGLDLNILRSVYQEYNGTGGVARNSAYCGLLASDCYIPYHSGDIAMLGAIQSEYAQAMQTHTRRDFTGLLDQFR